MSLLTTFCTDFIDQVFIPYTEKKIMESFKNFINGEWLFSLFVKNDMKVSTHSKPSSLLVLHPILSPSQRFLRAMSFKISAISYKSFHLIYLSLPLLSSRFWSSTMRKRWTDVALSWVRWISHRKKILKSLASNGREIKPLQIFSGNAQPL